MKNAKLIGLFAKSGRLYAGLLPGFLAALLLAGCFNPITAIPPKTGDPITDPFTINIMIGKDGSARTVAGPDSARIKGDDIRNFIQLVVVNNETKQIVAFDEDRRESGTDGEATLSIESIAFGKTYTFLLLMGHWEHNNYTYYDGKNDQYEFRAPTLLAAGLKELPVTGSGTITIVMWPIVVDTVFTTTDPEIPPALQTAGSVVDNGKPGTVSLFPVGWGITWTVKKGTSGNGFEDLVRAQKVLKNDAGDELLVKSKKPIVRGDGLNPSEPVVNDTSIGNVITLDISAYTSGIQRLGTAGSANFNLEYIPFNLTDGAKWTPFKDNSEFDLDGNSPVWIIRNGINNKAQNYATDFTGFGKNAFANGNGAVSFEIGAEEPDPNHPKIGDPAIKNGKYEGPAGSLTPAIGFTTEGYTGTAGVYYAVVDAGASKPAYTAYTGNLGFLPAGTYTGKPITLPISGETGYQADGDYDVYVVVLKGGKVSKPVKINTTKGGEDIDYIWGDVPYLKLYVRSNGNNNDEGDKDHPLETVDKALEKIAAAYAADASWPEKGTPNAVSAGIVVLDTVNVTQTINITGTSSNYPPIFLTDEGYGGTLQADSLSSGSSLLSVFYGTNVTLDGGLILKGTGVDSGGVYVYDAAFTMNGGVIQDNYATNGGGGVSVNYGSTFIMNGGVISHNSANGSGGGVLVCDSKTKFIMNGGKIRNNFGVGLGAGVYATLGGTFTMYGGEISDNATNYGGEGGGVYVYDSTFIMIGGEILNNEASFNGGGVSIFNGMFKMSGNGIISNNEAGSYGGGVYISSESRFEKTGGIIYGSDKDELKNTAGADGQGHAVYGSSCVDTTLKSNDDLLFEPSA